ncbi:hypothetical protein JVT61DRAFT_13343 [Boletus reticuloceps]|uniref:Uncharacterized protein n=1 Tax=Boletus reticuloceps TaxID=495285 RepID=A0A8I2YDL0_9AGAM|nr:hypothetical protein JVT61DRAFT_13343 [Boletus reticuloceps]
MRTAFFSRARPGLNIIPQRHFAYVNDKLDLGKDCRFDSTVKSAHWDDQAHRLWHIYLVRPYKASARHLLAWLHSQSFESKPYTPELKGLDRFPFISGHGPSPGLAPLAEE